jgi:RNA-directed DNA polymerase
MSLTAPLKVQALQRKLSEKAKQEPDYRFYALYDKIWREDVMAHAYELAKANQGAPGVDGQSVARIEMAGREAWLAELAQEVRTGTYQPQPVRRVLIPKAGNGERPRTEYPARRPLTFLGYTFGLRYWRDQGTYLRPGPRRKV